MSGAPIISGKHEVREPGEHGNHEEEDEDRRVDREQAVELLGRDEVHAGLGQLRADEHREHAADEEEEERGDHVLDADDLVVSVDLEVIAPRVRAVVGVLLRARRAARHPVEPVVAGADAEEEEDRHRDQLDDGDRVGVDHRVLMHGDPDDAGQREPEREADDVEQRRAVPAGCSQLRREGYARSLVDWFGDGSHLVRPAVGGHFVTLARKLTSSPTLTGPRVLAKVAGMIPEL